MNNLLQQAKFWKWMEVGWLAHSRFEANRWPCTRHSPCKNFFFVFWVLQALMNNLL
jgi:hypothetical protein